MHTAKKNAHDFPTFSDVTLAKASNVIRMGNDVWRSNWESNVPCCEQFLKSRYLIEVGFVFCQVTIEVLEVEVLVSCSLSSMMTIIASTMIAIVSVSSWRGSWRRGWNWSWRRGWGWHGSWRRGWHGSWRRGWHGSWRRGWDWIDEKR